MANNFLILGTFAALGWVFVNGSPPSMDPTAGLPAPRTVAARSSTTSYAIAGPSPVLEGPVLEAHRDPVPLVRNVHPLPAPSASTDAPPADTEQQAQDDLDRKAARAAIELDGYKRVSILGKTSTGLWRARGYRGTTAVLLTVDGTGRVSME